MNKLKNWKKEYDELEKDYNRILAEKLDLEYKCAHLESESAQEREQKEEILKLHESARKLKHDMKNHIMVITAYIKDNQYEQAKEYLSNILDKLNNMYTYIETGNSLMNHILNAKLEMASNMDIHVKAVIENLSFSMMESVDFISVLSNLLDNAIEGCSGKYKELHVEISRRRGYEAILVKNSIEASVLDINKELKSTKVLELTKALDIVHGYGILQIKNLAKKYEGICQFYEENSMFCACVMIPVL